MINPYNMKCPHCSLTNICTNCKKEIENPGRTNTKTKEVWCTECHKVMVKKEQKEREEEEKRREENKPDGIIAPCPNRDYTEKLYSQAFRHRPRQKEKAIAAHRKNVAKNTKDVVKLNQQQKDYIQKSTEHLPD